MRRHGGESFVPRPHCAWNDGAQFFREGERVVCGRSDCAVEMAGESDDDTTNIFFAHYFGHARHRVFVLRPFDRLDGMRQKLQRKQPTQCGLGQDLCREFVSYRALRSLTAAQAAGCQRDF